MSEWSDYHYPPEELDLSKYVSLCDMSYRMRSPPSSWLRLLKTNKKAIDSSFLAREHADMKFLDILRKINI